MEQNDSNKVGALPSDRAVVNGAASVSALRASVPSSDMPVISMWQPYASLLFAWDSSVGDFAKAFETRRFRLPERLIGKPIAIHATQRFAPDSAITPMLHDLCYDMFGCAYNHSLPRGAIIGVVEFARARRTEDERAHQPESEIAAGDWGDGRWAWPVMRADLLREPIQAKGKQGWWRFPAQAMSAGTAETSQEAQGQSPASAVRQDAPNGGQHG
ncbi:hypothetical protein [Croceibacterium aestuarii]|uniref:hypothetical protein n=1 Tax=Croceibacterium aestuarii TaxID=3064139 RepID=UPI00272E99AD|nr:hypothetical protein [Croceibacterium sp. D39]